MLLNKQLFLATFFSGRSGDIHCLDREDAFICLAGNRELAIIDRLPPTKTIGEFFNLTRLNASRVSETVHGLCESVILDPILKALQHIIQVIR